ncbi:hypothetical protein [Caulobacter sp. S45]|uniref:hypothetical protein n=1 Tax=Caulobacter sp. S45 TaxID=1641861 RepID=UPI001575E341|nr:hypothetical protein [Caulobacter sp. S45]
MTGAMVGQTSRYERKREAILEAAATPFYARGLGGATIAEAQPVTGMINAAAEPPRWSPLATADTAADLFLQPLMTGVFTPLRRR